MTKEEKLAVFEKELNLILNEDLRAVTEQFLVKAVPEYFWEIPASSSGKYHPSFDQGEQGLIRHTKMVIEVALELLNLEEFHDDCRLYKDDIIVACLLHDTFKNGKDNFGYTINCHADVAAAEWELFTIDKLPRCEREYVYGCIKTHMGQWSYEQSPNEPWEKLVHLADYIASRKFFDKFKED